MATIDKFLLAGGKMLVVELIIVAFIVLSTSVQAQPAAANASKATEALVESGAVGKYLPMPTFLEGVKPGMSREALFELRKRARGVAVKRSDDSSLLESVAGSPFADNIFYMYSELLPQRVELVGIIKETDGAQIKKHTRGFVKGAVSLWGTKYDIYVSEMRHRRQRVYEAITLEWQIGDYFVACTFPSTTQIVDTDVAAFTVRFVHKERLENGFKPSGQMKQPAYLDSTSIRREVDTLLSDKASVGVLFR